MTQGIRDLPLQGAPADRLALIGNGFRLVLEELAKDIPDGIFRQSPGCRVFHYRGFLLIVFRCCLSFFFASFQHLRQVILLPK